ILRPPSSTLFPYTTLFRSLDPKQREVVRVSRLRIILDDFRRGDVPCHVQRSNPQLALLFTSYAAREAGVPLRLCPFPDLAVRLGDRKSTRLNSSHVEISYA